jgi:hypothetical protein
MLKVFVAESVSEDDFYDRNWEGNVAQESLRINKQIPYYRIVMTLPLLRRAVRSAAKRDCQVFHLSCHGCFDGVTLTNGESLNWQDLAKVFQPFASTKRVLVLSSCVGGDAGAAQAFQNEQDRFGWIIGPEATDDDGLLTFSGACIAWPILYTQLSESTERASFDKAIDNMNRVTPHQFVRRRWDLNEQCYRRHPGKDSR